MHALLWGTALAAAPTLRGDSSQMNISMYHELKVEYLNGLLGAAKNHDAFVMMYDLIQGSKWAGRLAILEHIPSSLEVSVIPFLKQRGYKPKKGEVLSTAEGFLLKTDSSRALATLLECYCTELTLEELLYYLLTELHNLPACQRHFLERFKCITLTLPFRLHLVDTLAHLSLSTAGKDAAMPIIEEIILQAPLEEQTLFLTVIAGRLEELGRLDLPVAGRIKGGLDHIDVLLEASVLDMHEDQDFLKVIQQVDPFAVDPFSSTPIISILLERRMDLGRLMAIRAAALCRTAIIFLTHMEHLGMPKDIITLIISAFCSLKFLERTPFFKFSD